MGVVGPLGTGNAAFVDAWQRGEAAAASSPDDDCAPFIGTTAARVRGFDPVALFGKRVAKAHDRLTLLLIGAADFARQDAGFDTVDARRAVFPDDQAGIVVGTFGSLRSVSDFDRQTVRAPECVTPTQFPNTVFCAAASYVAIRQSLQACSVTLTGGAPSSCQAIAAAADRLAQGPARQILAGGAEEVSPVYALAAQAAFARREVPAPRLGEGAAIFALERQSEAERRGARALATIVASASTFSPNPRLGYERCLERAARIAPSALRELRHVFFAGDIMPSEVRALPSGSKAIHLTDRLGFLGAASGAFALAVALADRRVEPGSTVLIASPSASGSVSVLVVQKLQDAPGAP
jgi:3-oxoacyl-[acyl-carrier-protein] synthase II